MNITRQDYEDVISELIAMCEKKQFANLVALYVGGSVARGDYSPGRSDIDLYAVTESKDPDLEQFLAGAARQLGQEKLPELARFHPEPVGVSFTTVDEVKSGKSFLGSGFEYRNFIDTGQLLWGRDIKDLLPVPTREQEINAAANSLQHVRRSVEKFSEPPEQDTLVYMALSGTFRTLCILLCGRGRYVSAKQDAVNAFADEFGCSHPLAGQLRRLWEIWQIWAERPLTDSELTELRDVAPKTILQLCDIKVD